MELLQVKVNLLLSKRFVHPSIEHLFEGLAQMISQAGNPLRLSDELVFGLVSEVAAIKLATLCEQIRQLLPAVDMLVGTFGELVKGLLDEIANALNEDLSILLGLLTDLDHLLLVFLLLSPLFSRGHLVTVVGVVFLPVAHCAIKGIL